MKARDAIKGVLGLILLGIWVTDPTGPFAQADSPLPPSPAPVAEDPGGGGGWLWAQMIEKADGSINKTYPIYYYQGQYYCDNDADIDYTLVYNMNYGQNPDSLRYLGVTQLGPNWVIPTAIYGVFWPITRHIWGSLPANCVSPSIIQQIDLSYGLDHQLLRGIRILGTRFMFVLEH
jgi:hypothetical protein